MRVCVLASGSKGNSTYIETEHSKILIDAGLSAKELEKRLANIKVDANEINAILVTHEHSDHVKGLSQFAKKHNAKIFAHKNSWPALEQKIGEIKLEQQIEFSGKDFFVGDLTIQTFDLDHDSNHCVGFSVIENGKKFTIATDLGHMTLDILKNLRTSDFVVLESNHDVQMLKNNKNYTPMLKRRILSDYGHISNDTCAQTILQMLGYKTRGVILAHLSEQNNSPELAKQTILNNFIKNSIKTEDAVYIDVASQDKVGNIYRLKNIEN